MIAFNGPATLDLELPQDETTFEFALLTKAVDTREQFADASPLNQEIEIVSQQLERMNQMGLVTCWQEDEWTVYEITPEICRLLFHLLMRRSRTPKKHHY